MTNGLITIGIYSSAITMFLACAIFFCITAYKNMERVRQFDFMTTVGLAVLFVGLSCSFIWRTAYRAAHLSRDASVWMLDHWAVWLSSLCIISGSVILLRSLTVDYWIYTTLVAFTVFIFKVF